MAPSQEPLGKTKRVLGVFLLTFSFLVLVFLIFWEKCVSLPFWGAFSRMLSSCDYWPHPGHRSLSDQWNPLCVLAWVLCVCIHALTWVTAQLCCSTRSSPSSDCIVRLDLNFTLAKKIIIIIIGKKAAGATGWNAFLRKTVQSDAPWVISTDFYLGLHLEREQTVKWEGVNKEERGAEC